MPVLTAGAGPSGPPGPETRRPPTTWREAWSEALYGPEGFSVRGGRGPRHDFSTSVTRGPRLAQALALALVRMQLTGAFDIVDVGSGDGRLLVDLLAALPVGVADRARPVAVEVAPRPAGLPECIVWQDLPPERISGLLIAHEYLDTVPCDLVERAATGRTHLIMTDDSLGRELAVAEDAWLTDWWPLTADGQRADLGLPRDTAWRNLTDRLDRGLAIAVDYGHEREARPGTSTLTGWSKGRAVNPRPDGDSDLTAHVALDACAMPGDLLLTQREALRRLGVAPMAPRTADPTPPATDPTPRTADPSPRTTDPSRAVGPRERLLALAEAAQTRALLDPRGLGGYLWLIHAAGDADLSRVFGQRENGP